jgi:hypothetical protein
MQQAPQEVLSLTRSQEVCVVVHATRLPFDPGSPVAATRVAKRPASYVEGLWSPGLTRRPKIPMQKLTLMQSVFSDAERRGPFSLRRGLDSF